MRRYGALVRYWAREGPPAHMAAAAFFGLRKAAQREDDLLQGEDLARFLGAFPGGVGPLASS